MEELTLDVLIRAKYAGSVTEMSAYVSLAIQTCAVVFGGIVLWRMSSRLHRKKLQERKRKSYFETPYSRGWKGKKG